MIINKMVEFFLQKHFGATIVLGVPLFTLGGTEFASIRRHQEKSIVAPLNTVRGFHQGVEQYIDDEKTQTLSEDGAYKYVRETFDLDKDKKLSSVELELGRLLSGEIGKGIRHLPYNVDTSRTNIFKAIEKIREEEKAQVK